MGKKTIFIIKTLINIVQRWFKWLKHKFHFFFVFFSIGFMNKSSHKSSVNKIFRQFFSVALLATRKSPVHLTISASGATPQHHSGWRCSQLTATGFCHRQSLACIWPFHSQMQQSGNQTISLVHLIIWG